jgi:MFS transporter, DHA1 family, multidrug resistance protein
MAVLLAAFAVGVGYGVVLPFLPFLLERLGQSSSGGAIQRTTGLLTGAYTIGPVIFAPLWGALSDRMGRRPVLLIGLLGFTVTLGLSAAAASLTTLYAARLLNGAFAAAVTPIILAIIADCSPDDGWRARRFGWVGIASISGLLAGPMIGGLSGLLISAKGATGLAAPLLVATGLSALATASMGLLRAVPPPRPSRQTAVGRPSPRQASMIGLLVLTGVSAAAIGSFHVGLALQGRSLSMEARAISLMFAECSLVMLVAQALVFSPWVRASVTRMLLVPTFIVLAGSFVLLSGMASFVPLRATVDLFSASAGVLAPILLFWISRVAGEAQGLQLGWQSAVASLGQTTGSVATGLFLASSLWTGSVFMIMAAVLALAGIAALPVARALKSLDLATVSGSAARLFRETE